jgi:hypothetical protein
MKNKQIKLCYYIDYPSSLFSPAPNIPIVLADKRDNSRWIVSHRRIITDKNNIQIGDASYSLHVYRIDLSDDKKTGLLYGDFTAHHEIKKNGKDYDILFGGVVKFKLGLRPGQTEIDKLFPINYVMNVDIECISAREIFEDKIKINSGKNTVTLKNSKDLTKYRIVGCREK